jgi:glycerophosphoryl diester phosphodiesterase
MYLIEVKPYADHEDVEWFYEKAPIVERILGRRADKLIVVAVDVDKNALERAKELGVDVVYGNVVGE